MSKRIHNYLLSICLIFFSAIASYGQNVTISATLDTNSIVIGQQTTLKLSATYSSNEGDVKITWPSLSDTLGNKHIEIVKRSKIDTNANGNSNNQFEIVQSQTLTLTSFDSGFYAIPPLKFIINGDSTHPKETDALLLQVNNFPVDTTKAIKEIKSPLEVPYGWLDLLKEYLPMIGYGLMAIALIIGIIYYLRKITKKSPVLIKEEPKIPAHILALQELEKLREQQLWQNGKFKEYQSAISEILRTYIEKRFHVPALEQTTDEIIQSFRSIVIDKESKEKLKSILVLSDFVKFAKVEPLPSENELSLTNAIEFVNGTLREEDSFDKNSTMNENTNK